MKTDICPNRVELSQFNSGMLEEFHARFIAEHLEHCDECCNALEEINAVESNECLVKSLDTKFFEFEGENGYRKIEFSVRQMLASAPMIPGDQEGVLSPGSVIGAYRIHRQLGSGGMGIVYEATHARLDKRVALKVLPADLSRRSAFRSRFIREMRALGAVQNQNVVSGFDAGESDGHLYLAMEFIDGLNLAEIQRRVGRLPVPEACEIARQVATGLHYIHSRQILHRDIKPSNLMIACNSQGEAIVKILDLGLARLESRQTELSAVTDAGQILGTLEFMAPEQAESTSAIDERADIYSLGATLYSLLTGVSPYSAADFDTPLKMLSAIANVTPTPIDSIVELPNGLTELVQRMLSRDAQQRPGTALELVEQLESYSQHVDLSMLGLDVTSNPAETTVSFSGTETVDARRTEATGTTAFHKTSGVETRWFLLLVTFAAGIIWLKTDGGYLKIESPEGIDVSVEVVRNDELIDTISVGQSKDAVWYRAGRYEVRLPASQRKSFSLENNVFTLRYRRKQTVIISRMSDSKIEKQKAIGQPFPVVKSMNEEAHAAEIATPQPRQNDKNSPPHAQPGLTSSQAKNIQQEWAEHLDLPVEHSVLLPDGEPIIMILIPPGEFLMGSSDSERARFRTQSEAQDDGWGLSHITAEGPQHRVRISKPFYIGKYEMTRAQWTSVMRTDPTNRSYHHGNPEVMPVCEVTWNQVQDMLNSLNKKTEKREQRFSLPTEAQWEYACRAGTTTPFHFGSLKDATVEEKFWYGKNVNRKEQPVGTSIANAWGLYDMHGNVHEWVQDRAGQYPSDVLTVDPVGPMKQVLRNDLHVLRGGSSWDPATACRSALRGRRPKEYKFHALGLRLVLQID